MLKPKYRNLSESVSDFKRMLDGMNNVQPLEKSLHQEMEELVREENELDRLDREIIHVENVLAGSIGELSEAEKSDLAQKYDQMHDKYHSLANRHGRAQVRASKQGNPALAAKHGEVMKRLRRKGKEYGAKQKAISGKRNIEDAVAQMESRDPAHMSRYRSSGSALQSFRVLAGLEEQTLLPRDAGLAGTTRHNADYVQMAEGKDPVRSAMSVRARFDRSGKRISMGAPTEREKKAREMAKKHGRDPGTAQMKADFRQMMQKEDSETSSHKKRMKRIAAKIHQAGSAIDQEYGEDFDLAEGGGSRARKGDRQAGQYAGTYGPSKEKETSVWDRKKVKKAYQGYSDDDKSSAKKHMRKGVGRNPGDSLGRYGSGGKLYKHMSDILKRKKAEGQPVGKETKKKLLKGFGDLDHGKPKLPK